ncbi:MAG: PTS sugar transporter subunit IIA [Spirochaetia bacterium]
MNITQFLDTNCILLNSQADTKDGVLKEIAGLAVQSEGLSHFTELDIYNALQTRETLSSTGIENGVALPHCQMDMLDEIVLGVMTTKQGIAFDSIDSAPAQLFFFIIGPTEKRYLHVHLLASLSRIVMKDQTRKAILNAQSEEEIIRILKSAGKQEGDYSEEEKKCLFTVYIQNQDYTDTILSVFSHAMEGSLIVQETERTSNFFNKKPLFQSFAKKDTNPIRIIKATARKSACNELIRQIHTAIPDLETETGMLLTVEDLIYSAGSVEL